MKRSQGAGPERALDPAEAKQQGLGEDSEAAVGQEVGRRASRSRPARDVRRSPPCRSASGAPHGVALAALVADHGAAVLDVVVERAVDVGDAAGGSGDEREPVVVVLRRPACPGTGSAASSRSRRNSEAAPVTVLAISSDAKFV